MTHAKYKGNLMQPRWQCSESRTMALKVDCLHHILQWHFIKNLDCMELFVENTGSYKYVISNKSYNTGIQYSFLKKLSNPFSSLRIIPCLWRKYFSPSISTPILLKQWFEHSLTIFPGQKNYKRIHIYYVTGWKSQRRMEQVLILIKTSLARRKRVRFCLNYTDLSHLTAP